MATMRTTRWWWIRHAPVINPSGNVYGRTDLEADCTNLAAVTAVARRLPADAVWLATPLRRTQATAAALRAAHPAPGPGAPQIEPDLIEQNFGAWQGRSYAEIGAYGQGAGGSGHRFWLTGPAVVPPEGESFMAVIDRVGPAIRRLTAAHAGRDIVAVVHGGTIRAALAEALALSPETALAFAVDPLSLTRIDHVEAAAPGHDWKVSVLNWPPLDRMGSAHAVA